MNKFPILCALAAVAAFPQAQTPLTITQSAGSATGELRMQERRTNGQNYVGIKAPQSVAANTVWALPTADGTTGQFLKTDGAGILGWGSGGSRIVISDYFWSQTPGGTLAAGVETITLTPCPVGVDATDTKNYAYISGGTGTAEAVQYTTSGGAGTCSSGAATGTIKVTVANSHSGAWTIQNAGFREAERASSHGDILLITNLDVYGPTHIEKGITLEGGGGGGSQNIITAHGDIVAIDIDLAAPVTLYNFSLYTSSQQVSAGAAVRVGVTGSGNHNCGSKIDNLTIIGYYYGIHLKDGCKPVITRNEIADSTKYGIYAQNIFNPDGGDGIIAHNTIGNTPAADAAIRYESGGGLKIIDNKILNNFQWGVDLYPNSGSSTGQLYITSNSFDRMKAGGIRASGTDAWYGVNVIGNIIIDAGEDGTFTCIEFANPGMVGGLFVGNMCQSGQYAVKASQGTQVKVAANTFTGSKVISSTVALDYDAPLATTHANRPSTADNGSILYCTDCTATGASGGTGAAIYRINGSWSTSPTGALQISQGGNSFGTDMLIGTNDAKDIQMRRNGALTLGVFSAQVEVYGFLGINTSGVNMRVQPSGSGIGNFGTFSNHPLGVYTDSAERWRWNAAGMFVPAATDTYDIGNLTTPLRVRGVYSKIVDTALAGGTGDYMQTRKLQLFDNTGSSTGASYWDLNVVMSGVGAGQNSYFYLRDNGGNTVWRADKIASGSPVATTTIYTDLLPDSTANARDLGKTGQRWDEINGASMDLSGAANITGNLSAAVINATGSPAYRVAGTTVINASRAATFTDLTINTASAPTVGYVWTATSTGGAGSWQAAAGVTAPLTLTLGAAGYSEPLTVANSTTGVYGACVAMAGTDTSTSTVYVAGRMCGRYDSASFTDELVTIQTASGVGAYDVAMSFKNQAVTMPGTLDVTGNISGAVINATGSPAYRVSGTTVINASRAATFTDLTINTASAPTVGYVWTATSTGGAGSWQAAAASQWTTTGSNIYYTTGNVGIGTASPSARLSLGTTTGDKFLLYDGGSGSSYGMAVNASGIVRIFSVNSGTDTQIGIGGGDATFSPLFTVKGSGNVGIGTASPGGKLDVVGGRSFFAPASEPYAIGARYVSTGGAVYFGATNGTATPDVQISNAGGGALMTLLNGGAVSIPGTLGVTGAVTAAANLSITGGSSLLMDRAARNSNQQAYWTVGGNTSTTGAWSIGTVPSGGVSTFWLAHNGTATVSVSEGGQWDFAGVVTTGGALTVTGATTANRFNATNTNPFQVSGTTVIDASRNASFVGLTLNGSITGDLIPATSAVYVIGSSSFLWNNIHADTVTVYTNLIPDASASANLGGSTKRWTKTWTGDLDITGTVTPPSGTAFSGTKTVRASGGASDCTLTFSAGIMTGGTC